MNFVNKILKEAEIIPSDVPNTFTFYHGGDLDSFNDTIAHKQGRYEYGPGLYLTTYLDVATRYSKGKRKLYMITVEKGNDLNDSYLSGEVTTEFIKENVIPAKRPMIISRVNSYIERDGKIRASIFSNILLNSEAIRPSKTQQLRQLFIDNNIDYELIENAFGWGELMMVLYNMKKIVNITRIYPKDKIKYKDLLNLK